MLKEQDVISAGGELSAPGSKKPSPVKKVFGVIGEILLLTLFTVVLSISGQITYDYTRYGTFFVNGMSMYPTLNKNVSFTSTSGVSQNGNGTMGPVYSWGDFIQSGTYYCDYGMMDSKSGFLDSLKRFDIVVTYYSDNDTDLKIKRLMALPGESWKFDQSGNFYVGTDPQNLTLVEQHFLDEIDAQYPGGWKALTYLSGSKYMSGTLGSDEYFVCGDNRLKSASQDSRLKGPIKRGWIQGQALVVTATCSCPVVNGKPTDYHPIWNSYKMPWALSWLNTWEIA
jgi:signal peptidase I